MVKDKLRPARSFLYFNWTQLVIAALVVTLSRGLMNALMSIGGLGTGKNELAKQINMLTNLTFAAAGWMSGTIVELIGIRLAMSLGAGGTASLIGTLYISSYIYPLPDQLLWVLALVDGVTSGLIWTAAGTMAVKFAAPSLSGTASTMSYIIYSAGAMSGGLLVLLMGNKNPSATETTLPIHLYTFVVGLMGVSLLLSFLICESSKIRLSRKEYEELAQIAASNAGATNENSTSDLVFAREEDSNTGRSSVRQQSEVTISLQSPPRPKSEIRLNCEPLSCDLSTGAEPQEAVRVSPPPQPRASIRSKLQQLGRSLLELRILVLLPFSAATLFHQAVVFNGLNYNVFNVRSRGFHCCMYWLGRIPLSLLLGQLLDRIPFRPKIRGMTGMTLLAVLLTSGALSAFFCIRFLPESSTTRLDFLNDDVGRPWIIPVGSTLTFLFFGGSDSVSQSLPFWIFSQYRYNHCSRVSHYVALFRAFQGIGISVAWLATLKNLHLSSGAQGIICLLVWLASFPGLIISIWYYTEAPAVVAIADQSCVPKADMQMGYCSEKSNCVSPSSDVFDEESSVMCSRDVLT